MALRILQKYLCFCCPGTADAAAAEEEEVLDFTRQTGINAPLIKFSTNADIERESSAEVGAPKASSSATPGPMEATTKPHSVADSPPHLLGQDPATYSPARNISDVPSVNVSPESEAPNASEVPNAPQPDAVVSPPEPLSSEDKEDSGYSTPPAELLHDKQDSVYISASDDPMPSNGLPEGSMPPAAELTGETSAPVSAEADASAASAADKKKKKKSGGKKHKKAASKPQ